MASETVKEFKKLSVFAASLEYWEGELANACCEDRYNHCRKKVSLLKKKVTNPEMYSGY